jgi:hypothetical protein
MIMYTLGVLLAAFQAGGEVKPERVWAGTLPQENLRSVAPPSGVIADSKIFDQVFSAWRPGEETPEMDFTKSVVVVGTIDGPNRMFVGLDKDAGDLRTQFGGTKIGGPGFGYILAQTTRDDVTSINGQPLDVSSEKPSPQKPAVAAPPVAELSESEKRPAGSPARASRESIRVAVRGVLETGVVAIGGETTGTVIRAKGITFEVQIEEPYLRERADALNGKPAVVAGELVVRPGVEVPQRYIIDATRVDLVPEPRRAKPKAIKPAEPDSQP